ncbi:hypothetical protein [Nocardia xishanensis]|nr:hypothetical protein [Nocardia xishanensis]
MIDSASGPFIYFATMYSKADELAAFAAERAKARGLMCFDVNEDRLLM